MNVLIDIEWVQENEESSITQFAAVRVTDNWEIANAFERLVCPKSHKDIDWEHMAYSGYSPDEFKAGVSEKTCISDFLGFLNDSDTILCWPRDTKRLLKQKVEYFLGSPLSIKCKCVNQDAYAIAEAKGIKAHSLYEMADGIGIATPTPRHKSINDVAVFRNLLSAFNYNEHMVQKAIINKAKKNRRERNADILSRVEYNYIYTPTSKVFHRPSCHLMFNAVDIEGCVYYKTAVKRRTPCRVCHPEPNERPQTVNKKDEQKEASPKPIERKVISARLLGNKHVEIESVKIVGCCHNLIHPGKLTRKLMEEHDCLGKNCKFFERNNDSTYWAEEENKKRQKERRKQARQAEKKAARKLEDELAELKDLFQSYADDAGYSMLVVRLEKERSNRYRLFYVSDNPFADGNRFPELLATINFFFPRYFIQFRHIRDIDGHFVTTDEYLSIKRRTIIN